MANDYPIRFTLSDKTLVIIKKVLNNKYDFEMIRPGGSRKTFIWCESSVQWLSNHGEDVIREAIQKFSHIMNK